MAKNDFDNVVLPDNEPYEARCLCVLVLDISGSMSGDPINELNHGLERFKDEVKSDEFLSERLELGIVTFESQVDVAMLPTLFLSIHENLPKLESKGNTKLVDGVRKAIFITQGRKEYYRKQGLNFYRPWIFLITDGEPDGDQDVNGLAKEIAEGEDGAHFIFWAVGVKDANIEKLKLICHQRGPVKLQQLKFMDLFIWLKNSFDVVSKSHQGEKANLPSIDPWAQIPV
jgi:uncharacterized protein YegL